MGRTKLNKSIKVGIIGCGNVASNAHGPAIARIPFLDPVGVVDPVKALRNQVIEQLGLPGDVGFMDHQDMLTACQPDYIVLAVPPSMRRGIVADCARDGVHVLSEKPIATRPLEAVEMKSLMDASGLKFGLVHNYLYYPEYRLMHDLIREGAVGDVRHITLNFLGVPDHPGVKDYRPTWRHESDTAGGGVLMDMIHAVYLAEFLFGESIEAVSAIIDNLGYPDGKVEDLALLHLYFYTGYGSINMGWGHGPGGVEVAGSSGRIMVFYKDYGTGPFSELKSFTLVNNQGRREFHPRKEKTIDPFVAIHQDFCEAIWEDREPVAPASSGINSLQATLAAYFSATQNCVIRLPLPKDHPVYQNGVAGLDKVPQEPQSILAKKGLFGISSLRSEP